MERVDLCESFKTEESCSSYTNEGLLTVMKFFPNDYQRLCAYRSEDTWKDPNHETGTCQNLSRCGCEWDGTECSSFSEDLTACANGEYNETIIGKCSYTLKSEENKCDTIGKLIAEYVATSSPLSHRCENPKIIEYDCSAVVVVPFFTMANLFISLLGISVIYFVIRRK